MNRPDRRVPVWIDGSLRPVGEVCVPFDSPTVHWGIGVFETIAVRDGRPLALERHLARLDVGAGRLRIEVRHRTGIERACVRVASSVPGGVGWIKVLACREGPTTVCGGPIDPAEIGRPVAAVLLPWRRDPRDPLCDVKTTCWAASALGLERAREAGADEGIWRNTRGHLAEGCASNLFVVDRHAVRTPGLGDGILPGIEREAAISAARELGHRVHEGKIRLVRLERAREAFLTSSVRGVRPLVRWNGRPVGRGEPGPVTQSIARRIAQRRRAAGGNDDSRSA